MGCSVNIVLCSGLGRGDIAMLFSLFHLKVLLAMMMILLLTICSAGTFLCRVQMKNVVPSKPALTVDGSVVFSCLQAFPKRSF